MQGMDLRGEISEKDGSRKIREVEREPREGDVTEAKGRRFQEMLNSAEDLGNKGLVATLMNLMRNVEERQ